MATERIPTPVFEISPVRWALWVAAFLIFAVVMNANVRYADGDARYALLTSQAILEHGSPSLDPYSKELDLAKLNNNHDWMFFYAKEVDHLYYDYPLGTPVLAIPFVAVGRLLGMDPIQLTDDVAMQLAIAAILCALCFLLLFRISNLYLGEWASLLFSLGVFAGSTLMSTMGTALWSQNFQTLMVLLALLELAEAERGKRAEVRGVRLGIFLFLAYLCRPTSAALILPVFVYLGLRSRRALLRTTLTSGGLMLLFVLWSWIEMRMFLPRYYDPTMWKSTEGFLEHWLPLWFGPARGLWAFTPALLLMWGAWALRRVRFAPLHLLVWAWLLLHTVLLMRSQSPWGGWSYGPRFYTEVVPGLALVLLMMAGELEDLKPWLRKAMLGFWIAASAFGIYVHSFQGLFNIETQAWNDNPNIDAHWADRRWDWRHPQFFASTGMRLDMIAERALWLQADQAGRRLPAGANILLGPPDPLARSLCARWNRHDPFGRGQKYYNSTHALSQAGAREFYFHRSLLPVVRSMNPTRIDSSDGFRPTLGEFLAANAQHEIVIVGKDDCTTGPALETRAQFQRMGSLLDSVKLRQSYLLHVFKGKVLTERWGDQFLEYDLPGRPHVHLASGGLFYGNTSSIVVDGLECSMNMRGMNVAVLDSNRRIIWTMNFDTHGDDHEYKYLWRAQW